MSNKLFLDILDKKRRDIIPKLSFLKGRFYLAGGTGLALQIGHRDSIDFDFFTSESFSAKSLALEIVEVFKGCKLEKTQEEKDTLTYTIDQNIKLSFFAYPYELIKPLTEIDDMKIASVEDIGAMKLSAITSRSTLKDYVDIYFILRQMSLDELLKITKEKFPTLNLNLVLKSLIYFDDVQKEPISFKKDNEVDSEEVKIYLENKVKDYLEQVR